MNVSWMLKIALYWLVNLLHGISIELARNLVRSQISIFFGNLTFYLAPRGKGSYIKTVLHALM